MKRISLLLFLAFMLIACQEPEEPTPTPDLEAVGAVTIIADDGTALEAEFIPGVGSGPRPAVLMVHMVGSTMRSWDEMVLQLVSQGYNTLVFDLRGHGETGGAVDWERAAQDVQTLFNYMVQRPETDPARAGLIGASIGANLALTTAAEESAVSAVVALSPGLDYEGVETMDIVSNIRSTSILFVASSEDTYAFESTQTLNESAPASQFIQLDTAGHGTEMLGNAPDLNLAIITWLAGSL